MPQNFAVETERVSETVSDDIELSIVMPCLNEAETLETCVRKAQKAIAELGISAEVLVADNGSTDGSREITTRLGARLVDVKLKGYGNALMGGITAARGKYVIMGDADDSYDFLQIGGFLTKLREGYDLVQGCRLPAGGGTVMEGAMPWSHRWIGNPGFSFVARWWFKVPIHDIYCGLRGFRADFYQRMNQRCTGMEFATEMIIKASLYQCKISEVPITLHPDGRITRTPHLKTFRDGWRTARFFMMYSPRWLFLAPGMGLILLGLIGYVIALPQLSIGRFTFDAHTLLFASVAILCGYQAIFFAIFTKTFGINEGLMPADTKFYQFFKVATLERGIVLGLAGLILGAVLLAASIYQWYAADFARLDYARTMRYVIPGATLTALGFQTLLSSFFVSILGMQRSLPQVRA